MSAEVRQADRNRKRKEKIVRDRMKQFQQQRKVDGVYCLISRVDGELKEETIGHVVGHRGTVFDSDLIRELGDDEFRIIVNAREYYIDLENEEGCVLIHHSKDLGGELRVGMCFLISSSSGIEKVCVQDIVYDSEHGPEVIFRAKEQLFPFHIDDDSMSMDSERSGTDINTDQSTGIVFDQYLVYDSNKFSLAQDVRAFVQLYEDDEPLKLSSGDCIIAGACEFVVEILESSPVDPTSNSLFKEVSTSEFGNWLNREQMEDRSLVFGNLGPDPDKYSYFSVIDGHSGRLVADFVSCILHFNLLKMIVQEKIRTEPSMTIAMRRAFALANDMVACLGEEALYCGATIVSALLWKEEKSDEKRLTVANVGDSRAVLSRGGEAALLTASHLATNESEAARLKEFNAEVVNGRLMGLAVTRAFGDLAYAQFGVSCEPYVTEVTIEDQDEFLIIASDGIWDVVGPQEAVDFIRGLSVVDGSAKKLMKFAHRRGSKDNISVVIVSF